MNTEEFGIFLKQLNYLKDNRAIALYNEKKAELTVDQRVFVLESFLIQCVGKIAGIEHAIGKKISI